MCEPVLRLQLLSFFLACAAFGFTSSSAIAGGDVDVWVEQQDAPEGVPAHLNTRGPSGVYLRISGSLNRSAGDHVDTYSFVVVNPSTFYATVNSNLDGAAHATFNSRLYLWSATGQPLLGNDDRSEIETSATIAAPSYFRTFTANGTVSTEANAVTLVAGQTYFLSITTSGNDPLDASGESVIDLSGPTGELAGDSPTAGNFDHWANQPDATAGDYTIVLKDATFNEIISEPIEFGDHNEDGAFDAADYVVWRKNSSGSGTDLGYETWLTRFGESNPESMGGSVPEPVAIILILLMSAIPVALRRSLRRRG